MGMVFEEKTTIDEFRSTQIRKMMRIPRFSSKIQVTLGRTFWKEQNKKQMDEMATKLITHKPDLKSERDFEEFMTKDQAVEMEDFMWRMYVVEDYSSTQTAIIFKCHITLLNDMRRLFKNAQMFTPKQPKQ